MCLNIKTIACSALLYASCTLLSCSGGNGDLDGSADTSEEEGGDASCVDLDGDGHRDEVCGGDDCDDTRDDVYPGGPEACDGVDNDCDDLIDEPHVSSGGPVLIEDSELDPREPDLAWTGSEFAVAWQMADAPSEPRNWNVHLARLSPLGTTVDSMMVPEISGDSSAPAMVWTGSELGIVWVDGRDGDPEIYFTRLDGSGSRLSVDVRITSNESVSNFPDITWTGSEFGVAWSDNRDSGEECTMDRCPVDTYFTRLDAAGSELGVEVRLSDSSFQGGGKYPNAWIVWTGSEFGVYCEENFYRVDSAGLEVGDDLRTGIALWNVPPVWTGPGFRTLFSYTPSGYYGAYIGSLDATGAGGTTILLESADLVSAYALVWSGDRFGISWSARMESGWVDRFCLMDPEEESCTIVTLDEMGSDPAHRPLAWTGSEFGIVWTGVGGLYFNRISVCL